MLKGFKDFISRGNVVDLAVAVVMGAAFSSIVNKLVADVITPLIAAIFGKANYGNLIWVLHGQKIQYGDLLNTIVQFVMTAAGIYFLIVMPLNKLEDRRKRLLGIPAQKKAPTEVELLAEIRDALAAQGQSGPRG